jgi:hypothetical protein
MSETTKSAVHYPPADPRFCGDRTKAVSWSVFPQEITCWNCAKSSKQEEKA